MIIRLLRKLHRYWYLGAVLVCFLPFFPFLLIVGRHPDKYFHHIVICRRIIGFLSSALSGFFYRFTSDNMSDQGPCIIVANHTSELDITALVLALKADFAFIGKHELLDNPVTGTFFRTIDIAVNRSSKMSSFKAYKRAADLLQKGRSVVIFPEGQITDEFPPSLQPFKNGAFKLAIEQQVPLLPIVIHDAWKLYWDDAAAFGSRPGICHVEMLHVINTTGMQVSQADELRDHVHQLFEQRLASEQFVTKPAVSRL